MLTVVFFNQFAQLMIASLIAAFGALAMAGMEMTPQLDQQRKQLTLEQLLFTRFVVVVLIDQVFDGLIDEALIIRVFQQSNHL